MLDGCQCTSTYTCKTILLVVDSNRNKHVPLKIWIIVKSYDQTLQSITCLMLRTLNQRCLKFIFLHFQVEVLASNLPIEVGAPFCSIPIQVSLITYKRDAYNRISNSQQQSNIIRIQNKKVINSQDGGASNFGRSNEEQTHGVLRWPWRWLG